MPKKTAQDWGSCCRHVIRATASINVCCSPSPQGITTALKGTGGLVTSTPCWKRAHVRTLNKEGQLCPGGGMGRVWITAIHAGAGPSQATAAVFPTGVPAPAPQTGPYGHPGGLPNRRGCLQGSAWCCRAAGWRDWSQPAASKCSQPAMENSGESLCLFFSWFFTL